MNTYDRALNYIHQRKIHSVRPGLHRISALLEKLGNPQNGLPIIHVAGTNGKGSTSTMLASVLEKAGYKTGCFTSPFIYDFRERFSINRTQIAQDTLIELTRRVQSAEQELLAEGLEQPTEFEIVTAIGMLFFQGCDIVVMEVGLGGRFDATNIIKQPFASVICSISLDHTEYLGNTIEEIAFEKAGIIKDNCPAVLCYPNPPEAIAVIRQQCALRHAPLAMGTEPEILTSNANGTDFVYHGTKYSIRLPGRYQVFNAATAIETLEMLKASGKIHFTQEQLQSGLKEAYIPSRLECIHADPYIFIDGGHNREGIDALIQTMDSMEELKEPVIIFGMMKDKPYQYAVQKLASRAKAFLTVQPPMSRAMTAYDLKNIADLFCSDCTVCTDYQQAARLAVEKCGKSILAAGSLYMAGAITQELKKLF